MIDKTDRHLFADPPNDFRLINGYGGHWGADGLEVHKDLGFGGVLYHMDHEGYLTDEKLWEEVDTLLSEAEDLGMSVLIYDEDGFPSGPAGGQVLASYPEGEARGLYYSYAFVERSGNVKIDLPRGNPVYVKAAPISGDRLEPGNAIDITGACQGKTIQWGPADQALDWGTPDRDRWLVMIFSDDNLYERTFADAVPNLKPSYHLINLMDKKAVSEFIRLTHERYYERCRRFFGRVIPAFFTDEPCLLTYQNDSMPTTAVPWHQEFSEWFQEKHGYDIIEWLPALYHNCGPKTKKVRCDYFSVVSERVETAYHQQLGEWCDDHGVASSGHLLLEERLHWHARFQGDYMRCLRHMQRPGIDVLSSKSQLTRPDENLLGGALFLGAKFCSSVKHHYRRERTLSETSHYQQALRKIPVGFEDVFSTLSWQYAMGIDTIVSFYGKGPFEAHRWKELNDYAGRLGLLLTGGVHICDIAVFYPIKSQWANFIRQTNELASVDHELQQRLDADFVELSMALLENQRDFDYLHQDLLLSAPIENGRLKVADEQYRVLILPPMDTEDVAVIEKAAQFARNGGRVITCGSLPSHSTDGDDGRIGEAVRDLRELEGCHASADHHELLPVLGSVLESDFKAEPPSKQLLVLHRRKESRDIYFIFNNSGDPWKGRVRVASQGKAEIWDPVTGEIRPAEAEKTANRSFVALSLQASSSTILVIDDDPHSS